MKTYRIKTCDVEQFGLYLQNDEKSKATVEKYTRDIRKFCDFMGGGTFDRETVIKYKARLSEGYAPSSVNSMIASLNCFLRFKGAEGCCVKSIKVQKQLFAEEGRELSRAEYRRLLVSASDEETNLIVQTICGTGIRVSELKHVTAEAVAAGRAVVECKNKKRVILISPQMQRLLIPYIKKAGIKSGPIFLSKNGNPLDRTSVWRRMKMLCEKAQVEPKKVFPHNLRHLFARTFYSMDGDIVRLADILGHSNINTTRIYTMETGKQHTEMMDRLLEELTT